MFLGAPTTWTDWAALATMISAPATVITLLFAGFQLRRSLAVEGGRFMLEVERMLAEHNGTHRRLRPGGDWCGTGKGPETAEEWDQVEEYMGLFEHCELLIKAGVLDLRRFKSLFGYRIENILANQTIVCQKLICEGKRWSDFVSLTKRLQLPFSDTNCQSGEQMTPKR